MPGTGNTTVPSTRDPAPRPRPPPRPLAALVIAWSAAEPHRVGEVALLDGTGPWCVGRTSDDLDQIPFARRRPRASTLTGCLAGSSLSRRQLHLEDTDRGLVVQNAGKARLRINGIDCGGGAVEPGDVLELSGHYLLLLTERAPLPDPFDWPAYRFGEPDPHRIVGESPAAWALRSELAFAGPALPHVLVRGPSGTGKELCAAALHALSPRARGPLVNRNAATFPPGLMDAELFGTAKNYPSGGMPERQGLVGAADRGTLFLDEIGEISPEMQAHLLRLLDAGGEYHRLGESGARRADVRLVCATNRERDALKHDFAARLRVQVEVPPLEARREDIPLLARHLVLDAARSTPTAARFVRAGGAREEVDLDPALVTALLRARYPTNVRQLDAILWRAMKTSGEGPLSLPEEELEALRPRGEPGEAEARDALDKHEGNVSRAAEALGVSRYALMRLMKKHGLRAR